MIYFSKDNFVYYLETGSSLEEYQPWTVKRLHSYFYKASPSFFLMSFNDTTYIQFLDSKYHTEVWQILLRKKENSGINHFTFNWEYRVVTQTQEYGFAISRGISCYWKPKGDTSLYVPQ